MLINAASLITEANGLVTTTTNTSVPITTAAETTVTMPSSQPPPLQLPPLPQSRPPLLSRTSLLQPSQSVLSLSLASAYPGAGPKRKRLSNVGDDSDQFINLDDSDDDSEVITIS